jgi:hypothetical protein
LWLKESQSECSGNKTWILIRQEAAILWLRWIVKEMKGEPKLHNWRSRHRCQNISLGVPRRGLWKEIDIVIQHLSWYKFVAQM